MVWLLIALLAAKPLPGESLGINFWKNLAIPRFMPRQGFNFVLPKKKDGPEQPVNEIPRESHGQYNPVVTNDKEYGRPVIERGYDAQYNEGQA